MKLNLFFQYETKFMTRAQGLDPLLIQEVNLIRTETHICSFKEDCQQQVCCFLISH